MIIYKIKNILNRKIVIYEGAEFNVSTFSGQVYIYMHDIITLR